MKVNINDEVRVKLTRLGRRMYSEWQESTFNPPTKDGMLNIQIWSLMEIFHPAMHMAARPAFVDNLIEVIE